ncbi:MAG: AAA family ATPase [Anaerolineae bacterium]|nr:AAA family ATPase [Anaerolineae bacterium]
MRITRFRIQGFKNIADVSVDGLSDINIFFGLNDVGKSNIFEAIALWHRLLATSRSPNHSESHEDFERNFGTSLFSLGGPTELGLDVELILEVSDLQRKNLFPDVVSHLRNHLRHTNESQLNVTSQVKSVLDSNKASIRSKAYWGDRTDVELHPKDLANVVPPIHIIPAERRFFVEQRNTDKIAESISHENLKKALFYAYLSSDIQQKKRFGAIKTVLSEPPFSLGELDVALDPGNDQIDIGFIRPYGRLPLENLGSGSQQLLLVLGQVFLNDFPIIALEEPEMNLSPQRQQELMVALRRLMQDPAIGLKQLFISTHSPYFEFTENFYDVTLDESGHTQVTRTTEQDWNTHFAVAPLGPETGARLNSLNQVRLYDGLIDDLDLQRGDLVVFVRNDAGRWEVRRAEEIANDLKPITASNGKS